MELFEEAFNLAEKHPQWVEENETILTAYILTLIKVRDFLKVEALMMRHRKSEKLTEEVEEFLNSTLKEERLYSEKEQRITQEDIVQKGYSIARFPLIEQLHILKETDKLSFDQQTQVLEVIASNPTVSQLIRSSALLLLSQYNVSESMEKINFLWFDEKKSICLKRIEPIEKNQTVQSLHQILEERLENNPSLHEIVSQELDLQIIQLYPYIDEIITIPELWVEFYLSKFSNYSIDYSNYPAEVVIELEKWFEKLSSFSF
jgi:hypothetical protein